mmetsp:Transcript_32715/g.43158  ORF Transcript_32715/g.43158 Transcript_32715/m.43158 type:complete len:97 (+) Transcript_32715:1477-1767(+)
MGVSKLKSRLVREAIFDFNRASTLDENPAVYDGLGSCYHSLRDFEEAINYFNQAISAKPNKINFLKNRARCYFDMGSFQFAIDDLDTALQHDPNDS